MSTQLLEDQQVPGLYEAYKKADDAQAAADTAIKRAEAADESSKKAIERAERALQEVDEATEAAQDAKESADIATKTLKEEVARIDAIDSKAQTALNSANDTRGMAADIDRRLRKVNTEKLDSLANITSIDEATLSLTDGKLSAIGGGGGVSGIIIAGVTPKAIEEEVDFVMSIDEDFHIDNVDTFDFTVSYATFSEGDVPAGTVFTSMWGMEDGPDHVTYLGGDPNSSSSYDIPPVKYDPSGYGYASFYGYDESMRYSVSMNGYSHSLKPYTVPLGHGYKVVSTSPLTLTEYTDGKKGDDITIEANSYIQVKDSDMPDSVLINSDGTTSVTSPIYPIKDQVRLITVYGDADSYEPGDGSKEHPFRTTAEIAEYASAHKAEIRALGGVLYTEGSFVAENMMEVPGIAIKSNGNTTVRLTNDRTWLYNMTIDKFETPYSSPALLGLAGCEFSDISNVQQVSVFDTNSNTTKIRSNSDDPFSYADTVELITSSMNRKFLSNSGHAYDGKNVKTYSFGNQVINPLVKSVFYYNGKTYTTNLAVESDTTVEFTYSNVSGGTSTLKYQIGGVKDNLSGSTKDSTKNKTITFDLNSVTAPVYSFKPINLSIDLIPKAYDTTYLPKKIVLIGGTPLPGSTINITRSQTGEGWGDSTKTIVEISKALYEFSGTNISGHVDVKVIED